MSVVRDAVSQRGCEMRRLLSFSILILFLSGCGGKKPPSGIVTGSVTYKGQPVNGAALILYMTTGAGDTITIPVSQDGTYRATDIPMGEYIVVVQPSTGMSGVPSTKGMDKAKAAEVQAKIDAMKGTPTIPIPDKYKKRTSSDLKMSISPGEATVNLELKD
jgi:hypothetical protein